MPPALTARPATPADHATFLRLVVELQTGDPLPERARWEAAVMPTTLFYEDAQGRIAAYSYHQILGDTGYVRHVVVDPAFRGQGLGRVVMDMLAAIFRGAGCTKWCLNVKPENAPAVRLYESVGMKRAYTSASMALPWAQAPRLPGPMRAMLARAVDPPEDAALEAAFDLAPGSLAASRAFPGRAVVRLVDPMAPEEPRVGLASFDPHFPGAFPFRVAHPSFARLLLEAMKPHARPEHEHVGLVIEDDAELVRMLLAHGATVRMEILHYRGALT